MRAINRTETPRRIAIIAAGVIWLCIVVLAYYVYHKPFDAANAVAIASTLGDLAVASLMLLLAAALGHRALRAFEFSSPLEAIVIQAGVGLGIVALGVFGLGWIGLLQPFVFWILVVGGLALLYRDVRALASSLGAIQLPRATRAEKALSLFVGLALGIALLFALAPPVGWDGLQYHLVLPKLALENARFTVPPDNLSLSSPSLVELLFLAAMGLKSDSAAQVVHWSYLVLMVGAVLAFGARYFSWRVGWLAAALLVAVPSVLLVATFAYNDAALMFYTLTALFWTLRAIETQRARDFLLAGGLAGLALGEKHTAVFVSLALAAVVFFQSGTRLPRRAAWLQAFGLGTVAFVLALPWYVRNTVLVGNPVYPFLFGGLYWDSWRAAWYSRFGTGLLNDPAQLLITPWTISVQGAQSGVFDATIGPLLLALLPFNLLRHNEAARPAPTRAMWFVVAVLFGFWLLGVAQSKLLWQTRLLFPAFPLLALLAAEGWNRLASLRLPQFSMQHFASLVIALVLGLQAVSLVMATAVSRPYEVLLGIETRAAYLTRTLGAYYVTATWVNQHLPQDARIVALWEPRAYYISRAIEPDAILDRWAHLNHLYGDADAIAQAWKQQGVTHVLLFRAGLNEMLASGYDPVAADEMERLATLEAKHLDLIYGNTRLELTAAGGRAGLREPDSEPYAIYELY